ncbi:MAG: hypothetical protein HZA93_06370 [Verrucomicrobia bacterium]|nr:hypothetical protein [Verrucomicrobiota bacterium]
MLGHSAKANVVAAVYDRRKTASAQPETVGGHRPPLQQNLHAAPSFSALVLLSILIPVSAFLLVAGAAEPAATPPAKNWVLPLFSDKEGFRTMTLRGAAVQPVGRDRIDVTDLNITIFSGDATARVDSVLLAQSASFFPKTNLATGEKHVRLVRDDLEVSGDGWVYDHAARKISLKQNTRVVFRAELNDILK